MNMLEEHADEVNPEVDGTISCRILLVEDSPSQQMAMKLFLEREGFKVITANNGFEGINKAFSEVPDIIISDIIMPELNGYQLCRLLKNQESTSKIPIILLTSLEDKLDRFWGLKSGADLYLVKDDEPPILISKINNLINKLNVIPKKKRAIVEHTQNSSISTKINHILDKLLFEATISNETRKLSNYINDPNKAVKEFFSLLSSIIGFSCAALTLCGKGKTTINLEIKEPISESDLKDIRSKVGLDKLYQSPKDVTWNIAGKSLIIEENRDLLSYYMSQLKIHGENIGSISVFSFKEKAFTQETIRAIELLSSDFAMIAKLILLYEENKRFSNTDSLTNLNNRRSFFKTLERDFNVSSRYKKQLSLIMLDVDHFKAINDKYGHQQGDKVLVDIAKILMNGSRSCDFVARFGGEEFIIYYPETGLKGAEEIAERLRKKIEYYPFGTPGGSIKVTISFGVTTLSESITKLHDFIELADQAMYQAKAAGRNRVCVKVAEDSMALSNPPQPSL